MDSLQNQVLTLSHKVDDLYQMIEQLSSKISQCLAERSFKSSPGVDSREFGGRVGRYAYQSHSALEPSPEHKDVLIETNYLDTSYQNGETELTPEIQIQRLTAQLTAAYNRIAALEEQLLAKRIH